MVAGQEHLLHGKKVGGEGGIGYPKEDVGGAGAVDGPATAASSTAAAVGGVSKTFFEDDTEIRKKEEQLAIQGKSQGWRGADVRRAYLEFFHLHQHVIYPSSPVVPHGDNTLLFINAAHLRRVVDTQKCIRAGGKHNDLEDVGKDVYHHTFFEMLGNWSFGDYFKKEAIAWAWNLLTRVYCIPPDRLYASYFGGDPRVPSCPVDTEARDLWLQYLPKQRVLPFGAKENFWEMADTGPCGPCSEIHYDRIGGRDAAALVNADDPTVLEIWNLVFMQYNREKDGSLKPLPAPCVDTGMGLERVVSVLQHKMSNYDTDLFLPIFQKIHQLTPGLRPYQGKVGEEDEDRIDTAYRVLADHIRCVTAAIADGAEPSNEGRGYVLRRILRRAVRYARQTLHMKSGAFAELVPAVVDVLGTTFPEMRCNAAKVRHILQREEQQFSRTLDKGVERFKKVCTQLHKQDGKIKEFPAEEAFTLYSTYGFPPDLTELMAAEEGLHVNAEELERLFCAHRVASENVTFKGAAAAAGLHSLPPDRHHYLRNVKNAAPTQDDAKYIWNVDDPAALAVPLHVHAAAAPTATAAAVETEDGGGEESTPQQELVAVVLDKTCFYAEQGGQVGDTGRLLFFVDDAADDLKENGGTMSISPSPSKNIIFEVVDTQKSGDFVLHIGTLTTGELREGSILTPVVDYVRRFKLAQHHTGTHLLNFALREVLVTRRNSSSNSSSNSSNTSSSSNDGRSGDGLLNGSDGGDGVNEKREAFSVGELSTLTTTATTPTRRERQQQQEEDNNNGEAKEKKKKNTVRSNTTTPSSIGTAAEAPAGAAAGACECIEDVQQRGSLVEERRLRFDYDALRPLDNNEILQIEQIVKQTIDEQLPVHKKIVPLKEALEIPGIRAMFGEVYPDPVRVVSVGPSIEALLHKQHSSSNSDSNSSSSSWAAVPAASVELCGGTHLYNASQLEDFVIVSDEALARGVRRLVALCGENATQAREELQRLQTAFSEIIATPKQLPVLEQEVQRGRLLLEGAPMIPLVGKRELVRKLDDLQKAVVELQKARSKDLQREGKRVGEATATKAKKENLPYVVATLPELLGDGKALDCAAQV